VSAEVNVISDGEPDVDPSAGVVEVVPPARELAMDEVRAIVGAKNVMGTCSG